MKLTIEQQLLARTIENTTITSPYVDTPCWECGYATNKGGYPVIRIGKKQYYVSTVAIWLWGSGLQFDQQVNHICDNRLCINPWHLKAGTQQDNMEDMTNKGRRSEGKKHSKILLKTVARGENHWRAKITKQQAKEILSYKKQNCRITDVINFMKLSPSTVKLIWYRHSWKHINNL